MLSWFLWASLFSFGSPHQGCREGAALCGPQDLIVKGHNGKEQKITVTWEDYPSVSREQETLIYEVEVFLTENMKQVHWESVSLMPGLIGQKHQWSWTSPMPLECASHSVRLRAIYKNLTSQWSPLQTIPGIELKKDGQVFPSEPVFGVNSNATFCCVLKPGIEFKNMNSGGIQRNATQISNYTYVINVHLQSSPKMHTFVTCNDYDYGVDACIGYPPADKNLICETRDFESVECHWNTGRATYLTHKTEYFLNTRPVCHNLRCVLKMKVDVGERNWTLKVINPLGMVELTDMADLSKRVRMLAPESVTATDIKVRNASLRLQWATEKYSTLPVVCQIQLNVDEHIHTMEASGVGLVTIALSDLLPAHTYTAKVRCGMEKDFWKWGDWKESKAFTTNGDVPDALDVWMQFKSNTTIICWKELFANQSHGTVIRYEVTWGKGTEDRRALQPPEHSITLNLDQSVKHVVTVIAHNSYGSSPPSIITIPILFPAMNSTKIYGNGQGFDLSWSASTAASGCGYVVDWCPTFNECTVDWIKVPANETNARIQSARFQDGVRYTLTVYYNCAQGVMELLDKREGYVKELDISNEKFQLESKQINSDIQITWKPTAPESLSAFICGYRMYYSDHLNVRTDDPNAKSLTATNLNFSSYTFTVKALTSEGESGDSSITVTLYSPSLRSTMWIMIPLGSMFILLSLVTALCYYNWKCVKDQLHPKIPKPVLKEEWFISQGVYLHQILNGDHCSHSNIYLVNSSELHGKTEQQNSEVDLKKEVLFTEHLQSQSPQGYFNQPLIKNIPSAQLTLNPEYILPQLDSTSSLITMLLDNPSYLPNVMARSVEYGYQPHLTACNPE